MGRGAGAVLAADGNAHRGACAGLEAVFFSIPLAQGCPPHIPEEDVPGERGENAIANVLPESLLGIGAIHEVTQAGGGRLAFEEAMRKEDLDGALVGVSTIRSGHDTVQGEGVLLDGGKGSKARDRQTPGAGAREVKHGKFANVAGTVNPLDDRGSVGAFGVKRLKVGIQEGLTPLTSLPG